MKYPLFLLCAALIWAAPLAAQSSAPPSGHLTKPHLTRQEHAVIDPLNKQEAAEIHAVRVDAALTKQQKMAKIAAIRKHYYHLRRAALQKIRGQG